MTTLSDLYDADKRTVIPAVRRMAEEIDIPHPLNNVQYADAINTCRHLPSHQRFDYCVQEIRA